MTPPPKSPSFWKSPLGRGLIMGGIALSLAFGAKLYVDAQKIDQEAKRRSTKGELEALHVALIERLKSQEIDPKTLPESTPWLPDTGQCGEVGFDRPAKLPEPWRAIVTRGELADDSRYQLKFLRPGGQAMWIARRDADCDGLYETHTLRGSLDWTSSFQKTFVETQNLKE